MKHKTIIFRISISFLLGLFVYSYQKSWIVFRFPFSEKTEIFIENGSQQAKKVTITGYWYTKDRWYQETSTILWSSTEQTVSQIINYWFETALQEKVVATDIHVETVALTHQQEALISLDSNPFQNFMSIHEKLMIMESILKTLRINKIKVNSIRFLLHQEPLYDNHLDLIKAWHISGYISA